MARAVGIGNQDFEVIRKENYFYVDKTAFIKEWWESGDSVTLITRPRRFGKTLTMSMIEKFFSVCYAGRGELFEGLRVWEDETFRNVQGTYPVLFLSFADIKETSYEQAKKKICMIIEETYNRYGFLLDGEVLNENEKRNFQNISADMEEYEAAVSLRALSNYLYHYYGKKVIILLDEYDTPMQEAYVYGYWNELISFTRGMFNSTFKTNPYLERAVMTGITRVSKESIFSDLNNLQVVTTTSDAYADIFGFTSQEVKEALEEYGLSGNMKQVKAWYDGFTFGRQKEIYNPWSIVNYLKNKRLSSYWANSSSNNLAGKLIRQGSKNLKASFERLLQGESIFAEIDEQIVYEQLDDDDQAVWSLLLASGYLKMEHFEAYMTDYGEWRQEYELKLTNFEVKMMFRNMVRKWFSSTASGYNDFIKALLLGNIKAMNIYMNKVALTTFSYFDTGKNPSGAEPERFYHGFVLGLMVELADRYILTSNRESGFGRYDVMLEPRRTEDDGILLEFKVQDAEEEKELTDTVREALKQIEEQKYETVLLERGVPKEKIRKYGFAFSGKKVLIGN